MQFDSAYAYMKREFSAGGLVYKKNKGETWWLIRRPSAGEGYRGNLGWNFPRGWIDKGETSQKAAIREVAEEGGVEAKIISKLDTIKIFFTDRQTGEKVFKTITFYLMLWEKDLKNGFDWETAETKWVNLKEGTSLLEYRNEKELLQKASELVKSQ